MQNVRTDVLKVQQERTLHNPNSTLEADGTLTQSNLQIVEVMLFNEHETRVNMQRVMVQDQINGQEAQENWNQWQLLFAPCDGLPRFSCQKNTFVHITISSQVVIYPGNYTNEHMKGRVVTNSTVLPSKLNHIRETEYFPKSTFNK